MWPLTLNSGPISIQVTCLMLLSDVNVMCLLMLQIDELLSLGVNVTVYNGQVMAAQLLCVFLLRVRSAWFFFLRELSAWFYIYKFSISFKH